MRIAYFADDGTEFETEEECREHEKETSELMRVLKNGVHAYDQDGNIIDFMAYDLDDLARAFGDVSFVTFDTEVAIEVFTDKADRDFGAPCLHYGIKRPLVPGERYFYDDNADGWRCLEDAQKELDTITQVFGEKEV